jgi:predicted HNH restriction endonuclease
MSIENYVYKKEVDWSLLMEGLTLPIENQVVFGQIMGRFLNRGEAKNITLCLNGKSYKAKITNVNFDPKFKRKNDTLQIRYSKNGELAQALQGYFKKSFIYLKQIRENRRPGDRTMITLPEDYIEYLAIYTTEYDDTYVLEPIVADDIAIMKKTVAGKQEKAIEEILNYDIQDTIASIVHKEQIARIRKLNRKISENLKLLYRYRCQICGRMIGEEYGTHIVEAHHIEYFVSSLNNNASNQMIVCPNHHSIIHDVNPLFDRKRLLYIYKNGKEEKLVLNMHL